MKLRYVLAGIICLLNYYASCASQPWEAQDVPVFIIIGQSNADGSAFFNDSIDREMRQWYESDANSGKMKIWYRSSRVENLDSNALGEKARWAIDGDINDAGPGWLNLWYRNENTKDRTAMNMIHGYGTYSTGNGTNCAQGRRGIEGEFGKAFQTTFPNTELYILKLGVSGSHISSWANPADDHNWNYFYENVYQPAIKDLESKGKRPRLAGVWWMQGCSDASKSKDYYEECLNRLADKISNQLGFEGGKLYVGYVPDISVEFGEGVREAQDEVSKEREDVEIVDTNKFSMQYEKNFHGYIHFDHAGQNAIADELIRRISAAGRTSWPPLTK